MSAVVLIVIGVVALLFAFLSFSGLENPENETR